MDSSSGWWLQASKGWPCGSAMALKMTGSVDAVMDREVVAR
jgi:hypothetical protein